MQSLTTSAPPSIYAQLERILTSAPFSKSSRSQRFLRHVVQNSLEEHNELLKEYAIAIHVFDRDPSYDPAVDATVRVEAGRLRSRLREYYADAGRSDLLVIQMPKGAYRASITERCPSNGDSFASNLSVDLKREQAANSLPAPEVYQDAGANTMYLGLAATFVFAAIVGGVMYLRNRFSPSLSG